MNERIENYIEQHSDRQPDYLQRLERASNIHLLNGRMCSGSLQGRFLKMIVSMIRPHRILELGTFSGYSALCMAEALEDNGIIDTVEIDDELEDFIIESINSVPHGSKIHLHINDCLDYMQTAEKESYDLIFIDADKKKYPDYYEECLRILKPGGFIIADNTLWDGHVLENTKPGDRQTASIKLFNDVVAADKRVEKVMLPIRDGLTLIRKLKP